MPPTLFRRKLAGFTLGASAEARRCATTRNIGEVQSMTTNMCPLEGADLNSLRVDLFRPPAFLISDCLPHPNEALQISRRDTWCGPSLRGYCETRAVSRGERPIVSARSGQIDDFTPLQCCSTFICCHPNRPKEPRILPCPGSAQTRSTTTTTGIAMSTLGYFQTYSSFPEHDRFTFESRHRKLDVRFGDDSVG